LQDDISASAERAAFSFSGKLIPAAFGNYHNESRFGPSTNVSEENIGHLLSRPILPLKRMGRPIPLSIIENVVPTDQSSSPIPHRRIA
jgi:hypothetical protein